MIEVAKQVPAAGAIVYLVKLFLGHEAGERQKDRELWANHMSQAIRIQEKTINLLEVLLYEVRAWREDLSNTQRP